MNRLFVFSENSNLYLDSNMLQKAFSQSRMAEKIKNSGFLAQKTDDGWSFSQWEFTGTKIRECTDDNLNAAARAANETVLYEGPAFEGRTLKALLDLDFSRELGATEKAFVTHAAAMTLSAMESAVKQKKDIAGIGAGGIFLSSDFRKIIFLPQDLFENAMSCAGEEVYAEYQVGFITPILSGAAAINFTQSAIAYRMLTGKVPFPAASKKDRTIDISDANFVPLKNSVWALDEKLSFFVDNALRRGVKIVNHSKRKNPLSTSIAEKISDAISSGNESSESRTKKDFTLSFPLQNLYRELGLTDSGDIPSGGSLNPVIRKSTISQEQFENNSKKEQAQFQKRLRKKRWLRKNRTSLGIAAAALLIASSIVLIVLDGNADQPTSLSLTSFETVEMFYSAVNNLDSVSLQGCSSGGKTKSFDDMVSNVYVAGRTRQTYEATEALVSPASWMNFNYDGKYNIFGITGLSINTTKGSLFRKGPAKGSRPKILTEENGRPIKNKDTIDYQVTYALVYNESEEELSVEYRTDTVHLEFHGKRWVITDILVKSEPVQLIDFPEFYRAYKKTFEGKDKDVLVTANLLRDRYPWIPTNSEILEAKEDMEKKERLF